MLENAAAYNKEPAISRNTTMVDKGNPLYHPFNFIAREYGNDPEILLKRLLGILGVGLTGNMIKNKKIKFALRTIQYSLTAGLLGSELLMHVKQYIKQIKMEEADPYQKRMLKVSKLLKIPEDNKLYGDLPNREFVMSPKIAMWFAKQPKTKDIKIIGYYNVSTSEPIENKIEFSAGQNTEVGIMFEYQKETFLWDMTFMTSLFEITDVSVSFLLGPMINSDKAEEIRKCILCEFVRTLDISNNILKFDGWGGLLCSPRRRIVENLNQFDVKRFISEIVWVLRHKAKRTYAFVGRQGTGKSSIIREIEGVLSEYMIIHLGPEDFSYSSRIQDRFDVCRLFQPVVVIIEDMDACGLKEKNDKTGTLLECIDEVNKDLNMVIIYSVNDTSLIHHTIINRPGRSDRVIEIFPPKTVKEAMGVILTRFDAIKYKYEKDFYIDFQEKYIKKVAKRCVKEEFTQAEITNAVVEQALIEIGLSKKDTESCPTILGEEFAEYLNRAVSTQMETRQAIKNCNFHNTNPDDESKECYPTPELAEAQHSYEEVVRRNAGRRKNKAQMGQSTASIRG